MDPLYVANGGKLLAFVAPEHADRVLPAMTAHELGREARVIGVCGPRHPGMTGAALTTLGGTRVVDLPLGEQLQCIC